MKKIPILFLLVVLASAAGWYVESGRSNAVADLDLENPALLDNGLEAGGNEEVINPEPAGTAAVKDLQTRASEIIARPIAVTASLSESSRQQAVAKINELYELIGKDYDDVYQWYDLGAYRRLIGDYAGAAEAWGFGVTIRPKDFIFYDNLGDLYSFYIKNYAKGEQNFLQSVSVNPQNVNAYHQLAVLYENLFKDGAKAENILLLGIKENPSIAALKIALGQYYARNSRKTEALKYLEEALKLTPENKALEEEIANLKQ